MSDYWESDEITNKERLGELIAENDALRAKAELFDVLAARVLSGAWHVGPGSIGCVLIDVMTTGERVHGATLAEAVEKAMKAEGETK